MSSSLLVVREIYAVLLRSTLQGRKERQDIFLEMTTDEEETSSPLVVCGHCVITCMHVEYFNPPGT